MQIHDELTKQTQNPAGLTLFSTILIKNLPIENSLSNYLFRKLAITKASIKRKAYQLREAAVELGLLTSEQFDEWVVPANMVGNL